LWADVIRQPSFPAAAMERERQIQLANIRAQKDELLASAFRLARRGLFGDASYGLHSIGTEESVQRVRVGDLKPFHAALTVPNNCVLAVFGDVKAAQVKAAIAKKFGAWAQGAPALAHLPVPTPPTQPKHVVDTRDKKQAVMVIGFPGMTLHDPDRFALELIQEACSDLGSRLFVRIREKLGLAYYVGAQNFLGLVPGYFAFYVGTDPAQVELVESELLKEAEDLRNHGLTAEELRRAKAKVIGQKKIARQDLGGYAMSTALDELYGLGYRHSDTEDAKYEAVTLVQVQDVARKYLRPNALVVAVIKPVS
jgi:zinc protease